MATEDMSRAAEARKPSGPSGRRGVLALAFGVFAVGTGEFVLAGLLPLLSQSLGVSVAVAGQVVTAFALTCATAAPVLTTLTAGWPRRHVLLVAVLTYLAGSAGTALAPSYPLVLVAQIIAAAGVGVFVPTASITAAALVPPHRSGRAIATVVTGFTAAVTLGAPLGTALGGVLGWRATMWFASALAILGMLGVLALVPGRVPVPAPQGLRQRLLPLADVRVVAILGTTLVGFTAVYIPYTYIGAVFAPATSGDELRLATLMFVLGAVGTVGNLAAGALADRFGGPRVVAGALVWLIASLLVLPLATASYGAAIAMVLCYGIAAFAITTPQQHRLLSMETGSAAVLVSLNQAVLYLAIAMSGVVGGLGISWAGATNLGLLAAVLAALALGLSETARRLQGQRAAGRRGT
ncbi:DHA1 family inner membrane transport protein [Lipingzhangella halophila]|uniref:DHA1 family inner membrane transport protein n=1 Tax=Lipingzhangella halophila TaxID=1783352 RepID=A0A7W7RJY7_9ACTN|nr:MFS transporter [Lipingzhangella halophila]MBB4933336.1 DHA1 family inner membrane transport protein [Lipingzhangella halophila]